MDNRIASLFLQPRRQRQAVHGAMNAQRNHHRRGEFGQPMRRGLVEMARRARRANVIDVFGDDGEKEIARSRRRQKPPLQILPAFRRDAAKRDAEQRSRAEADEGAKLSVRPGNRSRSTRRPPSRCRTPGKSGSKWRCHSHSCLIANRLQFNKSTGNRKSNFGVVAALVKRGC